MIMIFGTFVANDDILSPGIVLHFFKILIFLVVSGVKGKKSCLLCFVLRIWGTIHRIVTCGALV